MASRFPTRTDVPTGCGSPTQRESRRLSTDPPSVFTPAPAACVPVRLRALSEAFFARSFLKNRTIQFGCTEPSEYSLGFLFSPILQIPDWPRTSAIRSLLVSITAALLQNTAFWQASSVPCKNAAFPLPGALYRAFSRTPHVLQPIPISTHVPACGAAHLKPKPASRKAWEMPVLWFWERYGRSPLPPCSVMVSPVT